MAAAATPAAHNMWYAHNYAQRRSQARTIAARGSAPHDYMAQPLNFDQDHSGGLADYPAPLKEYLMAQYARTALQARPHAQATTARVHSGSSGQSHSRAIAPLHTLHTHTATQKGHSSSGGRRGEGSAGGVGGGRSRARVVVSEAGPDQPCEAQGPRPTSHTSSRTHTFSIDQSHALAADQALAHLMDHNHVYAQDQPHVYPPDQTRVYTPEHSLVYGGDNHVYLSEQGQVFSGEQSHPYLGEQNHVMYSGAESQSYGGNEGQSYLGSEGLCCPGNQTHTLHALYHYDDTPTYTSDLTRSEPGVNRSRGHGREQQASQARHHPHLRQQQQYRVRPHARDRCSFYPESAQSSDQEDEAGDDDVRVDLPYTHLRCRGRGAARVREEYLGSARTDHFIRRYQEGGEACDDEGEAGTVGLSYQQRADVCTTRGHTTPTYPEVSESSRRGGLLLAEGLVREWVRAVGVVAASGTLVTLVVIGFGVYNMLITTLFLLFVLTTVALLIFLLMRRPPCCPCCHDPYDASAPGSTGSQTANITYLTESHGIVVKKWMKDSPPPYESPPDYSSLSPELIMDAKTLSELVVTGHNGLATSTTTGTTQPRPSSPLCTTPLFSSAFCDSPGSLTPTIHHEAKVYECPTSPMFTHHQYASPTGTHLHPVATTYSSSTGAPSPPNYESVSVGRRKDDNQLGRVAE